MSRAIKDISQQYVTVYKTITSASAISIAVTKDGEVVTTVVLSGGQVTSFVSNDYITLATSTLVPSNLVDGWYDLDIIVDTVHDTTCGFGYTATATYELYSKVALVDPRTPDYKIGQVLHTAKMLLDEMNTLEAITISQRSYQFNTRHTILKEILGYD